MRKKQLIQKNNELSVMLHDSEFENERLKNGVKHLRERCEALERELEELKKQMSDIKNNPQNTQNGVAQICEKDCAKDINASLKEEDSTATVNLSSIVEYGSAVIGEIVIMSAKFADELSVHGEKYRELINLILGRTEVEKANILEIVNSEAMPEDKQRMIDTSKANCEEYFNSVMAQRCE